MAFRSALLLLSCSQALYCQPFTHVDRGYNEATIQPGRLLVVVDPVTVAQMGPLVLSPKLRADAIKEGASVDTLCDGATRSARNYLPFTDIECVASATLPDDDRIDMSLPLATVALDVHLPRSGGPRMPPDRFRWVLFVENLEMGYRPGSSGASMMTVGGIPTMVGGASTPPVLSACGTLIVWDNLEYKPVSWGHTCGGALWEGGLWEVAPQVQSPALAVGSLIDWYLIKTPFGYTRTPSDVEAWRKAAAHYGRRDPSSSP